MASWVPEEGAVQRGCEKATKIFVLPSDICTGRQSLRNRECGKNNARYFLNALQKSSKARESINKAFCILENSEEPTRQT